MLLILTAVVLAGALFGWVKAETLYESHLRSRDRYPILFLLTGINSKYIDDRELWIRQFRWQLALVVILYAVVLLAVSQR